MQLPNIPTDHLYKFSAILGLFVWLISYLYPQHLSYELRKAIIANEAEIELVEQKIRRIAYFKEDSEKHKAIGDDILDSHYKSVRQNIINKGLDEAIFEIEKKSKLGQYIGLLLMIFGFTFWYLKIQRHLDRELKDSGNAHDTHE